MKKYSMWLLVAMLSIFIVISACRPPEVEGLVVRINQELYDDETYELAEQMVQTNPNNAEAWYYYGWLHGRKGDFKKMNEAFDKSLALNPGQNVKTGGATISIQEAVRIDRMNYFAENHNSGVSHYKKGFDAEDDSTRKAEFEKAQGKFVAALEVAPDREEPLQPLANTYLQLGDTLEAEKVFLAAVEKKPDNDTLMMRGADFYLQANQIDKAEEMYRKALQANPNNAQAYLGLGDLETKKSNWAKAAEYFEKALEMDPGNANVAFNIGVSLYNQEKYAEAIPYLRRIIEAEPDNKELYEILGICYVQSRMFDEGLPFLEGAVQRFPEDSDLWNYLAIIYANKGMKAKAEEALQKTKELEGNM
jgi:tetratricopeptide (TPR) repeat protein